MGICRLSKALLGATAYLASIAPLAVAGALTDHASATIQANATVVNALGMTAPQDTLVVSCIGAPLGAVGLMDSLSEGEVYPLRSLLVHFPCFTSVAVTVESQSAVIGQFPLSKLPTSPSQRTVADLMGPGAVLVNLKQLYSGAVSSGRECTVTLIYTEN